MLYRIGIDVGENSVGLAAIQYSDEGKPTNVLAAFSHIHDGGMTPGSAKSPVSRLASAGVARRTRRLIKNRTRRLAALDRLLGDLGWPNTEPETGVTYQQWRARAELLEGLVEDEAYRHELLSLAIRHIARHRGWRNPWWSFERLFEAETPTKEMQAVSTRAAERFQVADSQVRYVGQIGALSTSRTAALRPRTHDGSLVKASAESLILSQQVQQADQLAELREILDTQQVSHDDQARILRAVFVQEKPHVPTERIGKDALPGMTSHVRAPMASLEFQEFRVRAAVANLRIGTSANARALSPAEHDLVVDTLLDCREESPVWADVAEWLGVPARQLRKPTSDEDGAGSRAPIDRTSTMLQAKFPAKSPFGAWWRSADIRRRAELVSWLFAGEARTAADEDEIADLLADADVMAKLDAIDLPSGRAAYSVESLRRMNAHMAETRCDAHTARKSCFGVEDGWEPPRPRLEDWIEHPTVDRIVTIVRRFMTNAVEQWGLPESVAIEHVRGSFMGPAALAEFKHELRTNERRNEAQREELRKAGVERPSRADVRRYQAVRQQNGKCLYCGTGIAFKGCELDHIVPSKLGGSNRDENLVAVCHICNSDKSHTPFAIWAARKNDPRISVAEAQARLREWDLYGRTLVQKRNLRAAIARRLEATTDEDFPDERSLGSTAYAAREMRFRIESYLDEQAQRRGVSAPEVMVFRGTMTSEARKAGGVDSMLRLRGKEAKSRFDRRHHAIDAAVLTTITASVAQTMGVRHRKRISNEFGGDDDQWRAFEGVDAGHRENWTRWRTNTGALATLLVDAVAHDRIPVTRSLRLTPRFGEIHAATVMPLVERPVAGAWTLEEISRVADLETRKRLLDRHLSGQLHEDGSDLTVLGSGAATVPMFAKNSAQIAVRYGSAEIGTSVHHARVYAWRTKRGEINYGYVRVFAGEFPLIGLTGKRNVLTTPLPLWSQSMLKANETLFKRIVAGEAVEIGWLASDDEIEFDPSGMSFGEDRFGLVMREVGDRHWIVTGFMNDVQISLAPAMLASEGVGEEQGEAVRHVLQTNRLPLSLNVALSLPACTVIRRTGLGRPRWKSAHLPVSWRPLEEAQRRLP